MNILTIAMTAMTLTVSASLYASPYVAPPGETPNTKESTPRPSPANASPPYATPRDSSSFFLGYELGEMTLNEFRNFAGEVGYSFESHRSIRLVYMNVDLTEKHLSSSSTLAVDGDNVAGLWRGAEFFLDLPVTNNIFLSPSVGYYDSEYYHTILDESVRSKSPTAGVAFSYLGDNLLGSTDFYWRFSLTYRYYFIPIIETTLGETIITDGTSEVIPWIFIGYRFK